MKYILMFICAFVLMGCEQDLTDYNNDGWKYYQVEYIVKNGTDEVKVYRECIERLTTYNCFESDFARSTTIYNKFDIEIRIIREIKWERYKPTDMKLYVGN